MAVCVCVCVGVLGSILKSFCAGAAIIPEFLGFFSH